MSTPWNKVKVNIPGIGERAYVYANYRNVGGQCAPNTLSLARQCMYIVSTGTLGAYTPGNLFDGLFPVVGEYVTVNTPYTFGIYTICYKVLEIIDEATFNTGTCVSCYNNGYGGICSDAFVTVPPYPGDPSGCLYTNNINAFGIAQVQMGVNQSNSTAFINTDCVSCTDGVLPVFEPNMLVNCCDPSETYQLAPALLEHITGTGITLGVNQLGINTFTQAFSADLYIGGAQTGIKCWHLKEDYPPFGPTAYQGTPGSPTVFDNCTLLDAQLITNGSDPCCGPPPTEYCCLTGVAGPAGPTTCTQVALGTCSPLVISNYSAGPFQSQQLCLAAGCATVADPPNLCTPQVAVITTLNNKVGDFMSWKNRALS
jgi:hypothetical protein